MLDYKRLTFIFLFLSVFLLATDTQIEKQIRKSLLSFFDIVVEESSQVGDFAPSSFLDTAEMVRIAGYNFFDNQQKMLSAKANVNSGISGFALTIASYLVLLFKFFATYVITFYPLVIFFLYLFFTSRFFRKNEFNDYANY